jgi:hypothetical protein
MSGGQRRLSKSAEDLGFRWVPVTDAPEQDGTALAQVTGLSEIPSGQFTELLIGSRPDGEVRLFEVAHWEQAVFEGGDLLKYACGLARLNAPSAAIVVRTIPADWTRRVGPLRPLLRIGLFLVAGPSAGRRATTAVKTGDRELDERLIIEAPATIVKATVEDARTRSWLLALKAGWTIVVRDTWLLVMRRGELRSETVPDLLRTPGGSTIPGPRPVTSLSVERELGQPSRLLNSRPRWSTAFRSLPNSTVSAPPSARPERPTSPACSSAWTR